jgi:hypothetical protein
VAQGSTDYRCLATIELPAEDVDRYDQLLCQATSVFTRQRWHLLLSAEKAAVFDTFGVPPGLKRKRLHVWSIPNFDSLPEVMAYAADDPSYVKAQQLTLDEIQNLYVVLRWDSPIGLPETPVNFYMMESLQMVNGVQPRETFATYMDNAVYKMNTKYGWKIVFAGNAATGVIDQYVNIWGMADITKLEQAIKEYRGDPSWAAVTHVWTSLWTPHPLPCFDVLGAPAASPAGTGARTG